MDSQTAATYLNQLKTELARRDRAASNTTILKLLEADAPLGKQWRSLAMVLRQNGECNTANRVMKKFVHAMDNIEAARFEQAAMLAQTGRPNEASNLLSQLPVDIPDLTSNAFLRGTTAMNTGDGEGARSALLEAVAANPGSGQAWLSLASLGHVSELGEVAKSLFEAKNAVATSSAFERANYAFACAKLMLERDLFEDAAAALETGAALTRGERRYDRERDRSLAKNAATGFDDDLIGECAGRASNGGHNTVFVTGLPRSGTTLVEQILVSHPDIGAGDEVGLMRLLEQDIGGPSGNELAAWLRKNGDPAELAMLYDHLLCERLGPGGRHVDKSLDASRHMGQIVALLPNAPIIWLRRDPVDCAWSCWRTYFVAGHGWSFDLADMAYHFRLEDQLFDYWSGRFPDRILPVNYEELVVSPETVIPAIATHCGLDIAAEMFEPHKTQRVVTTASVTQVRQPIHAASVGIGEPARRLMQPFVDAYDLG